VSNKVIYAIYNDDDILMDAVKKRAAHHHIEEVFTHSSSRFDKAMGIHNKISYLLFFMVVLESLLLQR
jgi:hypothetical protein